MAQSLQTTQTELLSDRGCRLPLDEKVGKSTGSMGCFTVDLGIWLAVDLRLCLFSSWPRSAWELCSRCSLKEPAVSCRAQQWHEKWVEIWRQGDKSIQHKNWPTEGIEIFGLAGKTEFRLPMLSSYVAIGYADQAQ
jgi:hypothetical protein